MSQTSGIIASSEWTSTDQNSLAPITTPESERNPTVRVDHLFFRDAAREGRDSYETDVS
jgi:hypothetical protein